MKEFSPTLKSEVASKLLAGLKEGEASYLRQVLEDRLRLDACSGMEPCRDETDEVLSRLACATCGSSNLQGNGFCGECAATLELAGP
jgi:hypothetical protein